MFKIYIDKKPMYAAMGIWIEKEEGRNFYVMKCEKTEWVKIDEQRCVPIEPTIMIPHYERADFLKALALSLGENNIKVPTEEKIIGLLGATKYHLEDMRKLVFKKKVK